MENEIYTKVSDTEVEVTKTQRLDVQALKKQLAESRAKKQELIADRDTKRLELDGFYDAKIDKVQETIDVLKAQIDKAKAAGIVIEE